MKKLLWLFVAIPLAIILIVFSVANREAVTLSLDPFTAGAPAFSLTLPFFVFLFSALITGLLIGGVVTWLGQGTYRKAARKQRAEAMQWRREAEAQRSRADELAAARHGFTAAGLPAVPERNRAA